MFRAAHLIPHGHRLQHAPSLLPQPINPAFPILCLQLLCYDYFARNSLYLEENKEFGERGEGSGAGVLYLPPYSSDLNPIEKAWARLNQWLRSAKARTQEALDHAIAEALKLITAENAQAWIRHSINGLQ